MGNGRVVDKEEYNSIPVYYCKRCLSLRILSVDEGYSYCDDCGSTDIETTDIYTWKRLYREKYGKDYINKR